MAIRSLKTLTASSIPSMSKKTKYQKYEPQECIIALNELRRTYSRLRRATKLFKHFIVRDPLDYIDFHIEADKYLSKLAFEVNNHKYHSQPVYLHQTPKSKGISRPTVILAIEDTLVYRYCIEQIEDELLAKTRQKNVRGGRKITARKSEDGGREFYELWFQDWSEHNKSLESGLKRKQYAVFTDIASYFETINHFVLKDLLRSDVKEKNAAVDLLFYFIEHTRVLYSYEVNTFTGLLQEDTDCSRTLAYYFLHPHDNRMIEFCADNNAEFYRFVDDMTILTNSAVTGKKALSALTESLRRLGLTSSIEKTSIDPAEKAKEELFFAENKVLTALDEELIGRLRQGKKAGKANTKAMRLYNEWKDTKACHKNWIKVLKRFYTLFGRAKNEILLQDVKAHIVEYPSVAMDKLQRYLVAIQEKSEHFNITLNDIITYLYSEENLYPAVESCLLELFLYFDDGNISRSTKGLLSKLSGDVFFKTNGYKCQSDYARAVACLLMFKFNASGIENVARHYLKVTEKDEMLKKYIIVVASSLTNQRLRDKVLDKAKREPDLSIGRFIRFLDDIGRYSNTDSVKQYVKKQRIYLYN